MTDIKREDVELTIERANERSCGRAWSTVACTAELPCDTCREIATNTALCERWLEARRARWAPGERGGDLVGNRFACYVYRRGDGTWEAGEYDVPFMLFTNEAEAREWVEARAIADGYEIVREP